MSTPYRYYQVPQVPQMPDQSVEWRREPCTCGAPMDYVNGFCRNGHFNAWLFQRTAAVPAAQPNSGVDGEDSDYRLLADGIIRLTNPPEDDVAEVSTVIGAVMRLVLVVRALPCTCPVVGDDYDTSDACRRCSALGRFADKEIVR